MCTGNCNQGRACDCVPDTDLDDAPQAPLSTLEAISMVVIYATSACVAGWVLYLVARAAVEQWV